MLPLERKWLKNWATVLADEFEHLTIVHIGVQYGASLVCSRAGAPEARIVGVDLDCGAFQGGEGYELVEQDSRLAWHHIHAPEA